MLFGWCKIKAAAKYAGVSERTFRNFLKDGLRHSRLPTKTILVRYSAIDEYLEKFECNLVDKVDQIVDSVVSEMLAA